MDTLIENLQKTIAALEAIAARPQSVGGAMDEWLDPLFQHKIDLLAAHLNTSSPYYQQAASAIKQAASQAQQATHDPAKIVATTTAVSVALGKLAKLLDSALPVN
jgi:hypothetical protein